MSHEHEQKHRSPRARRREEAKRRTRIAVPFFAVLLSRATLPFDAVDAETVLVGVVEEPEDDE